MRAFSYRTAASVAEAVSLLREDGAVPLGGGTDLLVSVDEGIAAPASVVDLTATAGSADITPRADGGLRIGGSARIHDVASASLVRDRFPMLAEACALVGTPALRNMGTIGGNLCQRPRCWYFRRGVPCFKNGGGSCPAREGENQYHAILDGGPCYIVHPSDPAVALTAMDAELELASAAGTRRLAISAFYLLPRERMDHETVLRPGEVVSAVEIPEAAAGGRQSYRKLMQRGAWDFALASIAAAKRADGTVRMALGGVSPRPWRVPSSVEEDVSSGGLDDESIEALAERALYDAEPLSKNGYKVRLAAALIRDAIRGLVE